MYHAIHMIVIRDIPMMNTFTQLGQIGISISLIFNLMIFSKDMLNNLDC